ncbi:MAG: SpoIIE family protein phosphatase [Clostridia bacterium]|nr:SpoIIE family protein phosphatase [Clostridia bacterium]
MENIKTAEILKKKKPTIKINGKLISQGIGIIVLSVLLGQGSVFETLYPFGFALVMALPATFSFFAFIGTSIGFLFSQTGVYIFRYIVCAFSLWLIRSRVLNSHSKFREIWFVKTAVCFLVCFFTGVAVTLPARGGFAEIIGFTAEGIIAGVSVFFYKRVADIVLQRGEKIFSSREMPCFYLAFATVIASLGGFEFFGFYPVLPIVFFAVLVMAHITASSGGGFCACASATALSCSMSEGYNIVPLILSGTVSGVFSPLGKLGCALSFLLAFSATELFTGGLYIFQNIICAVLSAVVFVAIPEKVYRKWAVFFREGKVSVQESAYRKDISGKLSKTAETVTSVCQGMNKISEDLKKIDTTYDKNIFCRVRQEVCSECENREKCWNNGFQYTLRSFEELTKNYREDRDYDGTPFAKLFLSKCVKSPFIQESFTNNFRKYDEKQREEILLDEKRTLVTSQMNCMSEILKDFAKSFSKCTMVDNELSPKVKDVFNSFSIRCTKVLCIVETEGHMTIKAHCKKIDRETDRKKLKEEIEKISLRKFSDPEIEFTDTGTVVTFRQKPWMKMKVGKIQLSSEESPICGDCLREFSDEFGNRTIILSDGMGTGGRAAVDAAMTAEYFGGLTENSVSFDNALKIVNSVLEMKSTNESLATIDAAKFNLFSGKVEFYKAGAAVSFVRKNGKCFVVEASSLPAGILTDVSFAKDTYMLSKGDVVVMVSDGVTNGKTDWIISEIEQFNKSNPDILAQKIAGTVCDKNQVERRDDITVVVSIMTA